MITDHADPHGLLKTLIAHGVVVTPVDGRPDLYTAVCPFDDEHPVTVDVIGAHRDAVAASAFAPIADQFAPGWRERQEWQPAFNVRPLHGTYHCFGCGHHGGPEALRSHLAHPTTSGDQR